MVRAEARGFTLLELLVVLALIAFGVGLVAPAGYRALQAQQERGWRADLRAQIEALPVRTFAKGEAVELDSTALRALVPDLPADTRITLERPLRYAPSGMAEGGTLQVQWPGAAMEQWRVVPATGEVQLEPAR